MVTRTFDPRGVLYATTLTRNYTDALGAPASQVTWFGPWDNLQSARTTKTRESNLLSGTITRRGKTSKIYKSMTFTTQIYVLSGTWKRVSDGPKA